MTAPQERPVADDGLDREAVRATAARLAAGYRCTEPAYGAPGIDHCAACCGGTMIAASSEEEYATAKVLLAVPALLDALEAAERRATEVEAALRSVLSAHEGCAGCNGIAVDVLRTEGGARPQPGRKCLFHGQPIGPPPATNCPECRDAIARSLRTEGGAS